VSKPYLFLAVLLLLVNQSAGALSVRAEAESGSDLATDALDDYITGQMSKHGIRGISLAVTAGTEIIYLKGYGIAGQNRPMTPQTPMYIGSQSKSFTGLAIAQLIEQGKIDPNEHVQTYIPWFRVADEDASRRITVNHLLHHTSGLSEAGFTAILPENASNEDVVRELASARLTAPSGVKHQYFNVGYDVLAVVVQNVSGMSYEQYIQQHIFEPLEMTRTYTDPALARENGLSQGYSRFFGFTVPQRQPHRVFEVSAGYIISTAEDMAHYAIAMDNGGLYQDRRVLSPEGMDLLFAPVQGYGMGWFVEPGHVFHGGANETFKTFVDIYPLRDLGIVLLINQGYMLDHFLSARQIFSGVESIVLGRVAPPVSQGWSVKQIGWLLLLFVLVLATYQFRNLRSLRGWVERSRDWTPARKAFDVAISFLIPTLILSIVFSQVRAFMGYRFNFTYQMITMFRTLPDIAVLMIVGSLPDYVQGCMKLSWLSRGRMRKAYLAQIPEDKKWIEA
jgi:CubicO group peptidase (beta-lactamase class C family)